MIFRFHIYAYMQTSIPLLMVCQSQTSQGYHMLAHSKQSNPWYPLIR